MLLPSSCGDQTLRSFPACTPHFGWSCPLRTPVGAPCPAIFHLGAGKGPRPLSKFHRERGGLLRCRWSRHPDAVVPVSRRHPAILRGTNQTVMPHIHVRLGLQRTVPNPDRSALSDRRVFRGLVSTEKRRMVQLIKLYLPGLPAITLMAGSAATPGAPRCWRRNKRSQQK
jgi:hypothetical protein